MEQPMVSIDEPASGPSNTEFRELLSDYRDEAPLEKISGQALKQQLAELMTVLTSREREVLNLRFGLADGTAYTLEEVGELLSVSRERIRQIEKQAVTKLRRPATCHSLLGFIGGDRRPTRASLAAP
jgi:RNA polymerase primary sigma factor